VYTPAVSTVRVCQQAGPSCKTDVSIEDADDTDETWWSDDDDDDDDDYTEAEFGDAGAGIDNDSNDDTTDTWDSDE
jgi:hypothetical protein